MTGAAEPHEEVGDPVEWWVLHEQYGHAPYALQGNPRQPREAIPTSSAAPPPPASCAGVHYSKH